MKSSDEIVAILKSQDNPEKLALLQAIDKSPLINPPEVISDLAKNLIQVNDAEVRFWAKKVLSAIAP